MATNRTVNGVTFSIPDQGDNYLWGTGLAGWVGAITNGMLSKSGGLFTLTGQTDFGASFGLTALNFTSRTINPALSGAFRLANGDALAWRNSDNSADLTLNLTANTLTFSGNVTSNNYTANTFTANTFTVNQTLTANAVTSNTITANSVTVAGTTNLNGGLNVITPLSVNTTNTSRMIFDTSQYVPTANNPQGFLVRNTNVYSNTLDFYGSGGWLFQSGGIDNNQPGVFVQKNVSSTTLGNTAWLELENIAGNAGTNPNFVSTTPVGGSIESIAVNHSVGAILALGAITGGSSYTNGTYTGVPLTTTGRGVGATATIIVSGGSVTTVTITALSGTGANFVVGDSLSAAAANIGGTGSGFTVPVATITPYNGKIKFGVVSGITGSSAAAASGYGFWGTRASSLNVTGVNSQFETQFRIYNMDLIGLGQMQFDGNAVFIQPKYDFGFAAQFSFISPFQSSLWTNQTNLVNGTARLENRGYGGSFIRNTAIANGSSFIYSECDDAHQGGFVARSNWLASGTGSATLQLFTDNSGGAATGWQILTAGTGSANTAGSLVYSQFAGGAVVQTLIMSNSNFSIQTSASVIGSTTLTNISGQDTNLNMNNTNGGSGVNWVFNNRYSDGLLHILAGGSTVAVISNNYIESANSATTGRFQFGFSAASIDYGTIAANTMTLSSNTTIVGGLGVNGVAPPTQVTGFGTPTGAAVIANFNGAAATLAQCSSTIAELITIMKAAGLIGA